MTDKDRITFQQRAMEIVRRLAGDYELPPKAPPLRWVSAGLLSMWLPST
jgi:hypothetical protein